MIWLAGTLELTSKVRYGISSRGVPSFRFIPYDKRYGPCAVGYSGRDLSSNLHAIVELAEQKGAGPAALELPRAHLIESLGKPTAATELRVLCQTYAADSLKSLRKFPLLLLSDPPISIHQVFSAYTFHIDPPGCKDVDDAFSFEPLGQGRWRITIHIADVAHYVPEGCMIDLDAKARATSFYTGQGEAICPMLPPELSEGKASLKGCKRGKTVALQMIWDGCASATDFAWKEFELCPERTEKKTTFTYEEAQEASQEALKEGHEEIRTLQQMTVACFGADPDDSHTWVEKMMILYNTKAAEVLDSVKKGILRRHGGAGAGAGAPRSAAISENLLEKYPDLRLLAFESAKFCSVDAEDRKHIGLGAAVYCYASSPLRRYCDLVNQRVLKEFITTDSETSPFTQNEEIIEHLNRRQKQAKAFSRDLFFSTELMKQTEQKGIVLGKFDDSLHIYIPAWKRIIKVRNLGEWKEDDEVLVKWFIDLGKARWKERVVFRLEEI